MSESTLQLPAGHNDALESLISNFPHFGAQRAAEWKALGWEGSWTVVAYLKPEPGGPLCRQVTAYGQTFAEAIFKLTITLRAAGF